MEYLVSVFGKLTPTVLFPIATLIGLIWFFLYYVKMSRPLPGTTEWITKDLAKPRHSFLMTRHPMEKSDITPLAIITVVFSVLAFFRLGDTVAPQSFFQFTRYDKELTLELDYPEKISSLMYYTGLFTGHYTLEFSADGSSWIEQLSMEVDYYEKTPTPAMNQPHSNLFKWRIASLNADNPAVRYIRITAMQTPIELGELAVFGEDGRLIPTPRLSIPRASVLFDEQELIPDRPSFMNSMYFDEIYHGRTALEHLRSIRPYERTHPPLGKEIIAASIYTLGMTPFGWRFPGALFGVLMLIVLYILLKNMFGKTVVAACGTLLLGFDFMRFVQTRIATIDTYGVFFILLAYLFMYRYMTTDSNAPFRKSLAPLMLSGLFFGLGCASKWIVIYAGAGLAVLYTIRLILLFKHYRDNTRPGFGFYLTKTLLFSVLFFCVVPAIIYCLSYIPYGFAQGMTLEGGMLWNRGFYEIIWDNQELMFTYHGRLIAEHPYSSHWWQWLLDVKPILYVNQYTGNMRSSFAAFGNPVVWWGGFIAMLIMASRVVLYRDGKAMFILIGYLSQLVPWIPVTRIVFIYHYFPSTLFIVMALAHVFDTMIESGRAQSRQAVYAYTTGAGTLFALFYPALSGVRVPIAYFRSLLQWIPEYWPFY